MKVKEGKEQNEAIKQINDDEELREIAQEDPDAILLHDPEGSVITTAGGYGCYKNSEEFLMHRLKVLKGSLDKLCQELDYDTYEFLDIWINGKNKSNLDSDILDLDIDDLVNVTYSGEWLGDLYNETV